MPGVAGALGTAVPGLLGGYAKWYEQDQDLQMRKQDMDLRRQDLKLRNDERDLAFQELGQKAWQTQRQVAEQVETDAAARGAPLPPQFTTPPPTIRMPRGQGQAPGTDGAARSQPATPSQAGAWAVPGAAQGAQTWDQAQATTGRQGPPPPGDIEQRMRAWGQAQNQPPVSQAPDAPDAEAGPLTQTPLDTTQDALPRMGDGQATDLAARQQRTRDLAAKQANPHAFGVGFRIVDQIASNADQAGTPYDPEVTNRYKHILIAESGGIKNPWDAVSEKKAYGMPQLMPDTARKLGVDPQNPVESLRGGLQYFNTDYQYYLKQGFDPQAALDKATQAYNAGRDRVGAAKSFADLPKETQDYQTRIHTNEGRTTAAAPGKAPDGTPPGPTGTPLVVTPPSQAQAPQLPQPTGKLSNPLQEGELGDVQRQLTDAQQQTALWQRSLAERPGNTTMRDRLTSAQDRVTRLTARKEQLLTDAMGPPDPGFDAYTQEQTGMSRRDLYQYGPKRDGLGGPETERMLRGNYKEYVREEKAKDAQRQAQTEARTKEDIRQGQNIGVSDKDGWRDGLYRDPQTGAVIPSRTPTSAVEAGQSPGPNGAPPTVVHIQPHESQRLNTLDAVAQAHANYVATIPAAKADRLRAEREGMFGENFEGWLHSNDAKYPGLAANEAARELYKAALVDGKVLGAKEAEAILPIMIGKLPVGQYLSSAAELAGGVASLGAGVSPFIAGHIFSQALTQGADALNNTRGVTAEMVLDKRIDALTIGLNTERGRLLHNPTFVDPRAPLLSNLPQNPSGNTGTTQGQGAVPPEPPTSGTPARRPTREFQTPTPDALAGQATRAFGGDQADTLLPYSPEAMSARGQMTDTQFMQRLKATLPVFDQLTPEQRMIASTRYNRLMGQPDAPGAPAPAPAPAASGQAPAPPAPVAASPAAPVLPQRQPAPPTAASTPAQDAAYRAAKGQAPAPVQDLKGVPPQAMSHMPMGELRARAAVTNPDDVTPAQRVILQKLRR